MAEAEEIFDLAFYRPAAFVFVSVIYRLPISPNQVTGMSLAAGIVSAWFFSSGTYEGSAWGAVMYAIANILDCADGQLARLQQSGTRWGRIIDGAADYISGIAIFTGIGAGLARSGDASWWLVLAAGLSSAAHAIIFDHYQSSFIGAAEGHADRGSREMSRFEDSLHGGGVRGRLPAVVVGGYVRYLRLQHWSTTGERALSASPEQYHSGNRGMIRLWSFLGPTTNRTALIITALAGNIPAYLWLVVAAGNLWLLVCSLAQRRVNRELMSRVHPVAAGAGEAKDTVI